MNDVASLFVGFGRVGLFAFGGGQSMIPLMMKECVERYGFVSEEEFIDAMAFGNALPGPISIKLAVAIGFQVAGLPGVLAAVVGVISPSAALMLLLTGLYVRFKHSPILGGALAGVRPAIVAMLAFTAIRLSGNAVVNWRSAAIGLAALTGLYLELHPVIVIAGAAVLGVLVMR